MWSVESNAGGIWLEFGQNPQPPTLAANRTGQRRWCRRWNRICTHRRYPGATFQAAEHPKRVCASAGTALSESSWNVHIHIHTHTSMTRQPSHTWFFLQQSSLPQKKLSEDIKKFWTLPRHIKCWQATDEEVAQPMGCKESGLTMPVPWMEKLTPLN